jgi:hypothetical protein
MVGTVAVIRKVNVPKKRYIKAREILLVDCFG